MRMIDDIEEANKILPAWFLARMMDDVWYFGLSMVNGDTYATEYILSISEDGKWLDINLLTEGVWQGNEENIPKLIWAVNGTRTRASVQVAHIVGAFELAFT